MNQAGEISVAPRFDEGRLVRTLERLPPVLRALFAASCAERLLPSYVAFSAETGRGDAGALTNLLTWIWESFGSERLPEGEVQAKIDACMGLIPQEDEGPWVDEQAAAEDAGAAVAYALRCRKGGESQEAAWAARCAYEALDHYVINCENVDVSAPGAEAHVIASALVQAGGIRILTVDMIRAAEGATIPLSEMRSAIPTMLTRTQASGVQLLQIDASFANPRLQSFVFDQVTKHGGTAASVDGRDVMTFTLGAF